jgi:hypothetical protein
MSFFVLPILSLAVLSLGRWVLLGSWELWSWELTGASRKKRRQRGEPLTPLWHRAWFASRATADLEQVQALADPPPTLHRGYWEESR